jgi:hypothetical protein
MRRVLLLCFAVAFALFAVAGAAQPALPDLPALLARVGAAVERYYTRAQSIICLETVRLQSIGRDLTPDMTLSRLLTYELRVQWDQASNGDTPAATVQRELLKINGRAPGAKDKPKCMDPTAVSPDTLAMLLPAVQATYLFTAAGRTRFKGRDAVLIDYKPREREPVSVKPHEDIEECWRLENMDGYVRGRVWIDTETDEVLRLDQHLTGFVDFTVPPDRKHGMDSVHAVFERFDMSIVFGPIRFMDPDETLTLPVSVDSLQVTRNVGVNMRETRRFTDYRRFLTGGRIVEQ